MKTYKHLIEYALSDECMEKALNKASKRKKNRPEVADVIEHKEEVKKFIRESIKNRSLKQLIHRGYIRLDGIQNKERLIVQPYFTRSRPEQWIQHIAIEAISKVITTGIDFHCCGSVPKKGVHCGKKYLSRYIERHQKDVRYCLKIDIRHFYQSIDTDLLKYKLERKIKDADMLYVLFWIIDNNITILEDGTVTAGGLPVGGYPSQWFANYFLQDFDHYMREQLHVKFYMRYMDDIVILSKNKRELHNVLKEIKQYLKGIRLELKGNYQVFKFDYVNKDGKRVGRFIDFMGFKFYRDKTTIRKTTFLRAIKVARRIKRTNKLNLPRAYKIISYKGWFDNTNTFNAFNKYIKSTISIKQCINLISIENKKGLKNETKIRSITKQRKTA